MLLRLLAMHGEEARIFVGLFLGDPGWARRLNRAHLLLARQVLKLRELGTLKIATELRALLI